MVLMHAWLTVRSHFYKTTGTYARVTDCAQPPLYANIRHCLGRYGWPLFCVAGGDSEGDSGGTLGGFGSEMGDSSILCRFKTKENGGIR